MLLITFGCILITSCSTEDVIEPVGEQKIDAAYLYKQSNNTTNWEALITTDIGIKSKASKARSNDNSLHAHGNFNALGGNFSFSGTQNNGGIHGSSEIEITFGPFGSARVLLETVSVVSAGDNEVIYGGQITKVIENSVMFPPPPPGVPAPSCDAYELGTYVYFVVKDNGQGNNASPDQVRGAIFNNCNELSNGGADFPWFFFGFSDLDSSTDEIKVND